MQQNGEVLVVEDDAEVNELVGAYAQLAGFTYVQAMNGASAIEVAQQHHLALVLLDVMLPDLDGFEICRQLKDDQRTRGIPIVMLTALDRDEYRQRALQCGASAYLTKPFDPDQLLAAIRDFARNGHPAKK